MSHASGSQLDIEGTGVDGSGAIAIKMVHTDSKWTIAADIIRLIFSICLLIFSAISVIYAIAQSTTTMPDSFPPWSQYLCLALSLFILGVLEGLQIGVVELAHKDPNKYSKRYPRAAKLLEFENKGRNVERFLMGRQVLVVFTVFVAARITTFNGFWAEVPDSLINGLMFSGFLGVILVVIVAQLTPQVLAAAYPIEFMNLPGMKYAFWACLIVESTGLAHAVWFLCVMVRKMVDDFMCGKAEDVRLRVASKTSIDLNTMQTNDVPEIKVTNGAEKAEGDVQENANNDPYRSTFKGNEDLIDDQMKTLLNDVLRSDKRDLFYIYGNERFMSPAQCFSKFQEAGLAPPQFLLPPDHQNHIPPHLVAMTLLKMYSEKCDEAKKQ